MFYELNTPIIEELYIPSVPAHPLQPLLAKYFEPCFESACELVMDAVCQDLVIRSTCKNLCLALQFIILDGTEKRIFQPSDSPILLKDLRSLENFFYADGNGIKSQEFVLKCTSFLKALAGTLMDKPSQELIEGGPQTRPFNALPGSSNDHLNKQVVYKILYHRNDPIAKKFIKSHPYVYG